MKPRAVLFFGLRNFWASEGGKRRNQLRGAIAGIALSLVPLVVVLEVANGMIEGITARYVEIGTFHLQIHSFVDSSEADFRNALDTVNAVPGVTNAFPVYSGLGLAYSKAGRTGVAVRALPQNLYERDAGLRKYLSFSSGGYDLGAPDSVLISREVAGKLKLKVGDRIRLLTARILKDGRYILRPNLLVVKGIFSTGYNELDSLSVYISDEKGRSVFPDPAARFIGVTVRHPYGDLSAITWNIRHALSGNWYVYTWYQIEKPMFKTFETTKNLLLFIMVLIVLVASVNISSSLVMLVIEKTQDIAVLKGLGASPGGIAQSFVFTGFVLGCIGTFIGIGAGLLVAVNINQAIAILQGAINSSIDLWGLLLSPFRSEGAPAHVTILSSSYYLAHIPIRLDWREVGAIAVLSVLLSTVAAWFPARRAAGIRPLEVLRKY